MSTTHSISVPARAALAGNPSDGHGGAVVSTVVSAAAATVEASSGDRFEVDRTDLAYATIEELSARVATEGCGHVQPLVPAALAVLHRHAAAELTPHRFAVHTTIPRSVGLAGSSAIVIATMRTMVSAHQDEAWAREVAGDPALLASLALQAERDVLGIAAGLQDRVVQSFGGTMAMEFGPDHMRVVNGLETGAYRRLGTLPPGLFVAYRADAASESGAVHASIDRTDPVVRTAMQRAAAAGRAAAKAIDAGDTSALGAAMTATFEQRRAIMSLDPAHVEMIEVARANKASANYTGSGGAIIALAPDDRAADALRSIGCTIIHV